MDPNELELEPDENHMIDSLEGTQDVRKDIKIQLRPKVQNDKNKKSRMKKTIRLKRNPHNSESITTSRRSGGISESHLQWNHTVKLIGDPSTIPNAHLCPICRNPILIYGRLKPCKHTYCFSCAKEMKECKRCSSSPEKVEECKFGDLFLCAYDAKRYSSEGCFSSYKSLRDLESHVNFRHKVNLDRGYYPTFLKILRSSQSSSESSLQTEASEPSLSVQNEMSPSSDTPTNDVALNDTSNSSTPDSKIPSISSLTDLPLIDTPPSQFSIPTPNKESLLGVGMEDTPLQPLKSSNLYPPNNLPIAPLNIHQPQVNADIPQLHQFSIPSHPPHHHPQPLHQSPMPIPPRMTHNQPHFHNNMRHPLPPTGIGVIPTNMPTFIPYQTPYNNSNHLLGYKHNFPPAQIQRPFLPEHGTNLTANNPIPTHPPMYTGSRPN